MCNLFLMRQVGTICLWMCTFYHKWMSANYQTDWQQRHICVCCVLCGGRATVMTHPFVPTVHWWLRGLVKLGVICGSFALCYVFSPLSCASSMLGNVLLMCLGD